MCGSLGTGLLTPLGLVSGSCPRGRADGGERKPGEGAKEEWRGEVWE